MISHRSSTRDLTSGSYYYYFFVKKKQQNEWSCDVRQNLFKTESKLWWTLDVFFDKSVFFIPVGWPIVMIRIAICLFNLYKIIWLNFEEVSFKDLLFWSNNILFKVQNNYLVFIILFFFFTIKQVDGSDLSFDVKMQRDVINSEQKKNKKNRGNVLPALYLPGDRSSVQRH